MKKLLKGLLLAVMPVTLLFTASLAAACSSGHEHSLTVVAAEDATCTEDGNIAYWYCKGCGSYFSDSGATTEIELSDTVIAALGHDFSSEWSSDEDGHWHACSRCDETSDYAAHADSNSDGKCDVCEHEMPVEEPEEPEEVSVTGVTLDAETASLEVGESLTLTATVTPEDATDKSLNWSSSDENVATVEDGVVTAVAAGTATITVETSDGGFQATCTITVTEPEVEEPEEGYEWVTTELDYETGYANWPSNSAEEIVLGRFTIEAGARFDTTSGFDGPVLNNQQKKVSFTLQGITNTVSFDMKCASSSGSTMSLYRVSEDGEDEVVYTWSTLGSNESLLGCIVEDLPAGSYYLDSVGSARIANLQISEYLQASFPVSISVSGATDEFLVGDEFETIGLNVTLNYANGNTMVMMSGFTVDSSAFDSTTAGTYPITVSYTAEGETESFTATYNVYVYAIDSIEIYDYVLNSSRVTQNLQKVFFVNSEFNYDNLAVHAIASTPDRNDTLNFVLSEGQFTVSVPDMTTVGAKTVTVTLDPSLGTAEMSYTINVLENIYTGVKDTYVVYVDASAEVSASANGGVTLNSLVDALTYLELANLPSASSKVIYIAPGYYYEKVEIAMPNVSLIGTGTNANDAIIEYNAANGFVDPSGTVGHSTDGSATVSVRETATGFYTENVTFSNYWNTYERDQELRRIIGSSGTQAVALLVQADQAVFNKVRMYSYQDTLYAQVGRQYYANCYISGRTDFIFGYNATAYFYNCEIHTIFGNSTTNGGYVVATKGLADGAAIDAIQYGYIFDNCDFTADDTVTEGTVSLARGWDTEMKIMIMNSQISGAYSKEAYGDTSSNKNDRYGNMNAAPVAEYLLEYNNTGDGAITESIENTCTIVDETTAAAYADFSIIFGTINGLVTYDEAWNPDFIEIVDTDIHVNGIYLNRSSVSLEVGETIQLTVRITPTDATNQNVIWGTTDSSVATVVDGLVTAVGVGECTIMVFSEDSMYVTQCKITVTESTGGGTVETVTDTYELNFSTAEWNEEPYTVDGGMPFNAPVSVGADGKPTTADGIMVLYGKDSSSNFYVRTTTQDAAIAPGYTSELYMGAIEVSGGVARRGIQIDLSDYDSATITIYWIASDGRGISLFTEESVTTAASASDLRDNGYMDSENSTGTSVLNMTVFENVEGGTVYYLGGNVNTVYLYEVVVVATGETSTEPETPESGEEAATQDIYYTEDDIGTTISIGDVLVSGDLFEATWGSKNAEITQDYVDAVTENDSRTFNFGILPNGTGGEVTITAKEDISITVYYTVGDSKFSSEATSKSGYLTWTINNGETQSSSDTANKSNSVAYAEAITLDAGDTLVINSSNNRFVLFGLFATMVTE